MGVFMAPFFVVFCFIVGPAALAVGIVALAGYVVIVVGHKGLRGVPILGDFVPEPPDEVAERLKKKEEEDAQQAMIEAEIEKEIALVVAREQRRPVDAEGARRQIADAHQMIEDAQAAVAAAEQHAKSTSGGWQAVAESREELEQAKERLEEALEDAQRFLPLSETHGQPLISAGQTEADWNSVRTSPSAGGRMPGTAAPAAGTAVVPPRSNLVQVTTRALHSSVAVSCTSTALSSPLAVGMHHDRIQGALSPGVGTDTQYMFSRSGIGPHWIQTTAVSRVAHRNNSFQRSALRWGLASLRRL